MSIKFTITTKDGGTLHTASKYCEDDIYVIPKLQAKKVTNNGNVIADDGYAGLAMVIVDSPNNADTSKDTVNAGRMLLDVTAHDSYGNQIVGRIATYDGVVIEGASPVRYSYNGVELPPLPEWDKETYPYASIYNGKILYISKTPQMFSVLGHNWLRLDVPILKAVYSQDGNYMWSDFEEISNGEDGFWYEQIYEHTKMWANHNIMSTNGGIYLAASDPAPIYENINITTQDGVTLDTAGKYCKTDISVVPKLQDKIVSENGSVTPDTGYAGLGTVTVNVAADLSELDTLIGSGVLE